MVKGHDYEIVWGPWNTLGEGTVGSWNWLLCAHGPLRVQCESYIQRLSSKLNAIFTTILFMCALLHNKLMINQGLREFEALRSPGL
jgi:succinate dehydrogenase hydrophobic anchor subunit